MTPNFILVQTHHHFHLRLLPLNLAPWEFMTGSWTMVFTSIHLSLRPSHSSTQGPSPFRPLLNQLSPSLSRVHLSNFRHQSRIWVSILTPDYLSINRFQKHVKRHISTSVPCAIFDHLSPLRQLRQWDHGLITAIFFSPAHLFQTYLAYSLFRIPLHASWPKSLALIISRLFCLNCTGFLFVTEYISR